MAKNYSQKEQFKFNFCTSLQNLNKLRDIGTFVPGDVNIMGGLCNFTHGIHVDFDKEVPTIYDVTYCNLTEFRGEVYEKEFSSYAMHQLLMNQKETVINMHADDGLLETLLGYVFRSYDCYMDEHPKCEYRWDVVAYIANRLEITGEYSLTNRIASLDDEAAQEQWTADLELLKDLVVPPFIFEYVI